MKKSLMIAALLEDSGYVAEEAVICSYKDYIKSNSVIRIYSDGNMCVFKPAKRCMIYNTYNKNIIEVLKELANV